MQRKVLGIFLAGLVYIVGFVQECLFLFFFEGWLCMLMFNWFQCCMYCQFNCSEGSKQLNMQYIQVLCYLITL